MSFTKFLLLNFIIKIPEKNINMKCYIYVIVVELFDVKTLFYPSTLTKTTETIDDLMYYLLEGEKKNALST